MFIPIWLIICLIVFSIYVVCVMRDIIREAYLNGLEEGMEKIKSETTPID